MKKAKSLLLFSCSIFALVLAGCSFGKTSEHSQPSETTKFTVTFDSQGGSSVASQEVVKGERATKPSDPTKENYVFSGWYEEQLLTHAFDFNTSIEKNWTLYAGWQEPQPNQYTVNFYNYDESLLYTTQVQEHGTATYVGETPQKPADSSYTYTFNGWDKDLTDVTENINTVAQFTAAPIQPAQTQLKTAVFADVQLTYKESGDGYKGNAGTTVHAYLSLRNHLQLCKEQGVDVLFMNGDIVNNAVEKYYELYQSTFESVYGTDESQYPEVIWNMGNHEWWSSSSHDSADAVTMFKRYARIETSNLVAKSNVKYYLNDEETLPTFYKVVDGVPFLAISGENSDGLIGDEMKAEIAGWLEDISELPFVQNGGPIYVAYHYALHTTLTHGNGSLNQSYVLEDLLKDYPQAIVFTGDTHYPGVNERTINQVDFTTINIGTSSYSRMDKMSATMSGEEHYYNMDVSGGKVNDIATGNAKYKHEYTPTIQFMETMDDRSTVINRYFSADDVDDAVHINNSWTIPAHSSKDNFEYTNDRFENTEYAQQLYGAEGVSWANNAEVKFGVNDGRMTVVFPDTNQYHYTEHFKIDVTGNTTKTYDVVSNYYKYTPTPENLYFVLEDLPAGSSYSVKVTAYDYFDNPSLNYLESNEASSDVSIDKIDNAISLTYTDISTRVSLDEHVSNSRSSVEYYYNGVMQFRGGATLNKLVLSEGTSAIDYLNIKNQDDVRVIVQTKVKNLTNDTLTFGLTVVDNHGTWKADFSAATQKTVPGNADWTLLQWDLTDMYGLIGVSSMTNVGLKVSSSAYNDEGYVMHFLLDDTDIIAGEHIDNSRGTMFSAGSNYSVDLSPAVALTETFVFDVKFTSASDTYLQFILGDGWTNYYGYYRINANGSLGGNYSGISVSPLDDGYYRVSAVLSELTDAHGTVSQITLFHISGSRTTASGFIDLNPDTEAQVIRGQTLTGGTNFTLDLNPPIALTETIVFDVKFTSASNTYLQFIVGGWTDYYGYYRVNANGTLGGEYDGISIALLPDGYYRVTIHLSELTNPHGTVSNISLFYIRGANTTASGYVDFDPTI